MVKFPDSTVRVLVEGLWRIRIKEFTTTAPYLCAKFELMRDVDGEFHRAHGDVAQRPAPVPGNHQAVPRAVRAGQGGRAEHRGPRPLRRPHRRQPESQPGGASEAARNRPRCRSAFPYCSAHAQPRAGGAHAQLQDPERRRHLHGQDASAISFCASRCAPSSANWARPIPARARSGSLREKIEQTPLPAEAQQGGLARNWNGCSRCRPPSPNTPSPAITSTGCSTCRGTRRRRTSWTWTLPRRSSMSSTTGSTKVKDRLLEFLAVIKPQTDSKAPSSASSARRAWARPPSARAWPTPWGASSPASPWAACGTRRRSAATAAPTSARCPAASSRPCAGSRAATR